MHINKLATLMACPLILLLAGCESTPAPAVKEAPKPIEPVSGQTALYKMYQVARAALVNEDYSVAAESHAGLAALPDGTKLPVGRREIGVWNFHRNIARLLTATRMRGS